MTWAPLFDPLDIGEAPGRRSHDDMPTADHAPSRDPSVEVELKQEMPGTVIGPYTLLSVLGEGGFGRVFLAEQSQPVKRRVALKIIKLGMDTRQVVARFEQERQALALMDHPHVAKVLDAGATGNGRLYFVMELCAGEPITAFCDRHKLTIEQRIELFQQVCQAVQHAHHKGIIHRDMKPGNVLVTMQDGKAHAKVIDFGIAKATGMRLTERTLFTEHRQLIGTPEYMSPEQAEGSLDIDTRTDVYALGVMLYELLSGVTPFDSKQLRSAAYAELQRLIRDQDPPRPSTRLSQSAATRSSAAACRQTDPHRLESTLRGELDWIVMQAMEKDRARRYDSPGALAADLTRYLQGQPVLAAPPSVAYRASKFVRRHRGAVIAASLIGTALVLGAIGTAVGFVRASSERDNARIARSDAEAVTDYLSQMLSSASPTEMGKEVTVRELLDKSSKNLDATITSRPVVEAKLRETMARTYLALGDYQAANQNADRALELNRAELGEFDAATLSAKETKTQCLFRLGDFQGAERLITQTLAEAEAHLPKEHPVQVVARTDLAWIYSSTGRPEDAAAQARRAYEAATGAKGGESLEAIQAMATLALMLSDARQFEEANALHLKTIERLTSLKGKEHPLTLLTVHNYAWSLYEQGKVEEALNLEAPILEMQRRALGPAHADTLNTENNLSIYYRVLGRFAEAEPLLLHDLEHSRTLRGVKHPDSLVSLSNFARFLMDSGKPEEAIPRFEESVQLHREVMGDTFVGTLQTLLGHGICLTKLERFAEAEPKLIEAYQGLKAMGGPARSGAKRAAQELKALCEKQNRADDAAVWKARADELAPPPQE